MLRLIFSNVCSVSVLSVIFLMRSGQVENLPPVMLSALKMF